MTNNEYLIKNRIQSEQIRTLFSLTPVAVVAHLFSGAMIVVVLWTRAPQATLAGWLSTLVLASIIRVYLSRYYQRLEPSTNEWRPWAAVGITIVTLFGLIWGAASILFLNMNDPVSIVIIVTVIVSLNAGSASTTSPYPITFYIFTVTTFAPMIWLLISSETTIGAVLAAFTVVTSLLALPLLSINVNKVLERSLRLSFENEALRLEAEQANAAKTRFLAAASHDLRQPIHALGLSFSTLADQVRNTETKRVIDQVEGSIDAVNTMLNGLLDISKLDAGIVSPNIEPVPISSLFHQLYSEFLLMARQQGNTLSIRPSRAWVKSDQNMLLRILQNLLGNALRYTFNGRVLLAARHRKGKLRLEVYDTGIGIPEDRFDDIFTEFQQLGNPQRDRRQGLGLGLAIVKRLASLLGHPIGLSSTIGRGSCFWIEVPLTQSHSTGVAPSMKPILQSSQRLRGARVLILDDEFTILESMHSLLENWGCEVATAATVDEAQSAARSRSPDLLIVDYRLPGEHTGLDAVSQLRNAVGAQIPALVITGDTAPERLREAHDSGYPLLHKPVQPARLRSAMQHLLRESQ